MKVMSSIPRNDEGSNNLKKNCGYIHSLLLMSV